MGTGYRLGEWTVRPHRNRIERGRESVHLEPKAMAVLDCLAKASNSVVTRQKIFNSVWPGAAVSDDVLTQRIAELRKAFRDSAHDPEVIETIHKVGFRLIPPVLPLSEKSKPKHGFGRTIGLEKWLFGGVILVALGLLIFSLSFWASRPPPLDKWADAETPAIAVLPFVNLSEDAGNEYFSDGITEELINLLAKVPGLEVRSRSSSFSFKGENWKMTDLARELNASLIVEGTVRKVDSRVRITAQLIDPATDKHLFSESFDRELSDIFSLQEEIAQSIVTALQDEIGPHQVVMERSTENIEAYELFFQGRHHFYQRGKQLERAIKLLQMAVDEDPEFVRAWAFLAAAATVTSFYQTSIENLDAFKLAEQASSRALALDPGLGLPLAVQAMLAAGYHRDLKRGFHLMDRAVDADPNDTTVRLWAGMYNWYWGYLEQARFHFQYVYKEDPRVGITNGSLGLVYLAQGREDLAAPRLAKATELDYPNHHHAQACLLMRRGDFDAAFNKLKITFASPGAVPVPISWIYELEEAGRAYFENPALMDKLVSVVERSPKPGATEKARLALVFDLKDSFFEYLSLSVEEGPMWLPYVVPTLWLHEYRAYIEDPRFFEIMRGEGAVEVWEQRGYLDGCVRINVPVGDRLDCSERFR